MDNINRFPAFTNPQTLRKAAPGGQQMGGMGCDISTHEASHLAGLFNCLGITDDGHGKGVAEMTIETLFGTTVPGTIDNGDGSAITIGVVFKSDIDGYMIGARFYKADANTGSHIGALYDSSGTLLVQVTFTGESANGWQAMNFASPYAITATTHYIMAVFLPVGHYSKDGGYFGGDIVNGNLTAIKSADAPRNGRYNYGVSLQYPNSLSGDSNYWVDVIFDNAPPASGQLLYPNPLDGLGYQFRGLQ